MTLSPIKNRIMNVVSALTAMNILTTGGFQRGQLNMPLSSTRDNRSHKERIRLISLAQQKRARKGEKAVRDYKHAIRRQPRDLCKFHMLHYGLSNKVSAS